MGLHTTSAEITGEINMLKILFLTEKGDNIVAEPSNYYGLEQEIAKIVDCEFAGVGWEDHRDGETIDETVHRLYGTHSPDWVIDRDNNLEEFRGHARSYRIGLFISDLHGKHHYNLDALQYYQALSKSGYDALFMRYTHLKTTDVRRRIKVPTHFVPWSVDTNTFYTREKTVDVTFCGAVDPTVYPLRTKIYQELPHIIKNNPIKTSVSYISKTIPQGFYGSTISQWKGVKNVYVGEAYADLLGRSLISIFDCSIYRYPILKYFESMASGCCVLADTPACCIELGMYKKFYPIDYKDWIKPLYYYLDSPNKAKRMGHKASNFIREKHSHRVRADEFVRLLKKIG